MYVDGTYKGVGETLRKLRLEKGISQETLAERLGKKQTEISRLEREGRNITLESIRKLSNALGILPSEFIKALLEEEDGCIK